MIYLGVPLRTLALRFVAGGLMKLLERRPALGHAACVLVGWAGLRLGLEALEAFGATVWGAPWAVTMPDGLFRAGMALIMTVSGLYARRRQRRLRKRQQRC